jgi:dTDP-4-amino-4,6-dideoxygalactose transaminase
VTQTGATVVFCDTDPQTYTIDPARIEAKVTSRTVGVIPVHLYGQPADMPAVMAIAEKHGLWVIEDCAQAHLARCDGRMVGSFGIAASYSFYPGKNLGAMGDAGAITTSHAGLAERMAMFARHGGLTKGDHQIEGVNSRLDGLQAAILSVKLRHLPRWTERASSSPRTTARRSPASPASRHRASHRDARRCGTSTSSSTHAATRSRAPRQRGIQTVVNYPVALPFLPAYRRFGHRPEDFPVAYARSRASFRCRSSQR